MPSYHIAIDTGGTFTDCLATDTEGRTFRRKVLSNGTLRGSVVDQPDLRSVRISTNWNLSRDILRGYTFRLLWREEEVGVESFDPATQILVFNAEFPVLKNAGFLLTAHEEAPVLAARLVTETALDEAFPPIQMRLGSTKGTNALLEKTGARVAFFVTKGFADLLRIGDQTRPDLFTLHTPNREPLHAQVIEVDEQISAQGEVLKPMEFSIFHSQLSTATAAALNCNAVAICLKNAYRNAIHEQQLAVLLRERFQFVSVSTELSPHIKWLHRAETTVVNAYLAPIIHAYLQSIQAQLPGGTLHVMTSAGALVRANRFEPKDSLLSGPAGGVVGAATVARRAGFTKIITFDMGGTSTDVARYDGAFDYRFETTVGTARLQAPALAIETVAAGGGSICGFAGSRLFVGPASAGAQPGPACYGAGGPLTLTDVNLLLQRLNSEHFGIPIFPEHAQKCLNELLDRMESETGQRPAAERILEGFIQIANETMAEAVRKISVAKGYDPAAYALVAFGGAGGLHACGVARLLGIRTILIPQDAGLLSAVGISEANIERFAERTVLRELSAETWPDFQRILEQLSLEAVEAICLEGIDRQQIVVKNCLAFLRFKGQEFSLELDVTALENVADWQELFREKYTATYGHWVEHRVIEVESLRVLAAETAVPDDSPQPEEGTKPSAESPPLKGPALLTDAFSTTYVEAGFALTRRTSDGTALIGYMNEINQPVRQHDPLTESELFTNRFRAVAEEMGAMLQRTALSVNVKERLDFSCALLDANATLIANAPHIPVHLGSLGVCVRRVREAIPMEPGDVIVTNHPGYGGSHLPDVTLITPVFLEVQSAECFVLGQEKSQNQARGTPHFAPNSALIGYVVNRCHHAEIGGIRPASMPPNARNLAEEGVVIAPMYLVKNGEVRWEELRRVLTSGPYPSRAVEENLADLAAALAANRRGEQALQSLVREHGLPKIQQFMSALLNYSAGRMRARLAQFPQGELKAEEFLDDGTRLSVKISFQSPGEPFLTASADAVHSQLSTFNFQLTLDFTGTAGVHPGNLNGTEAIVQSVVVYVLRVLLGENVPLNEGLLASVKMLIPEDSILNPPFPPDPAQCPAVVGGNVELSQRLTDLLFKAFGVAAGSQGTMNNVLFGKPTTSTSDPDYFGYYETLGGGGGAGEGFAGSSGVQQHMTNTRITDPEILEHRYPVRLHRFEIRRGSGGAGRWPGGDGLRRELEFLVPVELSVLTQNRTQGPGGMHGGEPGQPGRQVLIRADGRSESLPGIAGATLQAGDKLVIESPGGGGWGTE